MKTKRFSLSTLLLVSLLTSCSVSSTNDSSSSDNNGDSSSISNTSSISSSEQTSSSEKETSKESESSSELESSSESESQVPEYNVNDNFKFPSIKESSHPTVEEKKEVTAYTPKTFSTSSYSRELVKTVTDGLEIYNVRLTLNDKLSRKVSAFIAEIDLNKVNIVAGSYDNTTTAKFTTLSIPTSMAEAWERDNPGKKALLTINADYFGSTCVNAFVKDGIILKDSHINDPNDVPVSSPMLFGVSTAGARIGPMTTTGNKVKDYTSSLYYGSCVDFYNEDGENLTYASGGNNNAANTKDSFCVIDKAGNYTFPAGKLYKYKKLSSSTEGNIKGCIVEVTDLPKLKALRITSDFTSEGYGYVGVGKYCDIPELEIGTYFQQNEYLASPSKTWDYYDTILGCRHSILENGNIPSTVAEETSNATATCAARSCVGIMPDGKVIILAIEDFIRTPNNANCNGMTLVQVADLLRYYGVYDAANFDGGGSTQLCTKKVNYDWEVHVRSSDYQTYNHKQSRKVLNSVIVTTK